MRPNTASLPTGSALHREALACGVRKVFTSVEEVHAESGSPVAAPVRQASAVAVLRNPWLGTATDTDLQPETERIAPIIAKLLSDRLLAVLGGAEAVAAFGKAAVVGLDGELEHAGALIHTPFFGNLLRESLEGTSIICFSDERAEASGDIRVPMWHKTHAATRSHYQSMSVHLADAPHHGEIAVIAAAATGSRPFPRIGDRRTDGAVTLDILKGRI
ncbi:MAG: amino acid synthesis family protein [Gulosibacter sp.]|uniref:amino acid synthesis family protein n=1 Tax=Gulosibacter sp. TaxID=2817531 RepID=UPI003F8E4FB8